MRNLYFFSILLFINNIFSFASGASEVKLPLPEIETLPNGFKIAWFVNQNIPVIDISLIMNCGFQNDPKGKSGTAELVAATLDRGVQGMNTKELARAVEMLGATRYVSADEETFSVGMHGLALDAERLLELLGKIALTPQFSEQEVNLEHTRLIDNWKHLGDKGEHLVSLAFRRKVTSGTEYGRGGFLSISEFKTVTRKDVLQFYQTCFSPKNALFLVVGKVDKSLFQKKVQSTFGFWTSGIFGNGENKKKDLIVYEDKRLATKKDEILLVERLGLNQAQVKIGFKAPLIYAPEHHALLVANALLGEYFNSRLNSIIRDKLALTYAIESHFIYNKNFAEFSVSSSTKNETIGQLIKKTLDILKDFEGGGISEEEIKMSKDYLIGSYSLSVSTLQAIALNWLIGYIFGLGDQCINDFIPKIKQVTRQEVIQAVKKYFLLDKVTIVIAGDPKPILKSLKESDFKKIKQIRLDSLL